MAGKSRESVLKRRSMTDHRAAEMIVAMIASRSLNEKDIPELDSVSFKGLLNLNETYFMGHSFGGVSAFTAGLRRPELVQAIVAHEPATDWSPDDVRRSLFPVDVIKDCPIEFDGGTGGLDHAIEPAEASIRDIDVFVLFSQEWYEKVGIHILFELLSLSSHLKRCTTFRGLQKWGMVEMFEWMYQHGKLSDMSEVGKVKGAHHSEFSDMCMMTPLWLARAVGVTGTRNPHETGSEIRHRTLAFLEKVRSKRK
jgi:hypothetical protein